MRNTINRRMNSQRRNVYLSGELNAAYDTLLPEYVNFSGWAERALWAALIDQYGQKAVVDAVEEAQRDLSDDELRAEQNREPYELPV